MSDTPDPEQGAVDELLLPGAPLAAAPDWQPALLLRTKGVLRRRRWYKRVGFAAALAACYLAGLATMRLAMPSPPSMERVAEAPSGPRPDATLAVGPPPRPQPSVPADVLERW